MSTFSFSFSGDDIEEDAHTVTSPDHSTSQAAETGSLVRPTTSATATAFPIPGQALLSPQRHSLTTLLSTLPSKISYSTLVIKLDDETELKIPRRELWDVRVQIMAEDEGGESAGVEGLGKDDVKSGVYEGGFKSWESSVDVVRVLASAQGVGVGGGRILELGCGTALPSLAVLHWVLRGEGKEGLGIGLADYNPSVLRLVTVPNLLLSWAQVTKEGWEEEGELDIDEELISAFVTALKERGIQLSFFSGAWSPGFVRLVGQGMESNAGKLTIIGAETIYSPFALRSFADTLMSLLESMGGREKTALVAAKKVYFGVGGSMEDFCEMVRGKGAVVEQIREESDGVRRAVVEVKILME